MHVPLFFSNIRVETQENLRRIDNGEILHTSDDDPDDPDAFDAECVYVSLPCCLAKIFRKQGQKRDSLYVESKKNAKKHKKKAKKQEAVLRSQVVTTLQQGNEQDRQMVSIASSLCWLIYVQAVGMQKTMNMLMQMKAIDMMSKVTDDGLKLEMMRIFGQFTTQLAAAQPAPQPAAQPAPQPAARPAPQPAARPAPQPAARPVPQPAARPAPQPAARPAPQPAARPAPQPAAQPANHPRGFELLDSISSSKEHRDCTCTSSCSCFDYNESSSGVEMWSFPDSVRQQPNLLPSPFMPEHDSVGEDHNAQVVEPDLQVIEAHSIPALHTRHQKRILGTDASEHQALTFSLKKRGKAKKLIPKSMTPKTPESPDTSE